MPLGPFEQGGGRLIPQVLVRELPQEPAALHSRPTEPRRSRKMNLATTPESGRVDRTANERDRALCATSACQKASTGDDLGHRLGPLGRTGPGEVHDLPEVVKRELSWVERATANRDRSVST